MLWLVQHRTGAWERCPLGLGMQKLTLMQVVGHQLPAYHAAYLQKQVLLVRFRQFAVSTPHHALAAVQPTLQLHAVGRGNHHTR